MPQDYGKLDTAYGSEAELLRCVAALKKRRIKALADLVLNHRCAQERVRTNQCIIYYLDTRLYIRHL